MWQCQAISGKLNRIKASNPDLANRIDGQMGFLTKDDLPKLIEFNRFESVLVRCGAGRFTCPAQDVQHFMNCLEFGMKLCKENTGNEFNESTDYVRDVSLPVS
jgi:hypothetical protein